MWFLYIIIGFVVGSLFIYLIQKPKMKTFIKIDAETAQKNKELKKEAHILEDKLIELKLNYTDIQSRHDEYLKNLADLEAQGKETCKKLYQQNLTLANDKFEHQANLLATKFQKYQTDVENEYLDIIKEMALTTNKKIEENQTKIIELDKIIQDKRALIDAMVEADKRAVEMEEENNFYKLILSNEDLSEINRLREVSSCLRDKEPINKIIWKVYYEKPYTDLISRVIGNGIYSGIYKITNTKNNMCYVGQSTNISDRWRQHIKRGLGAETPTRNKLYPAMQENGVENFTFEVIEICDKNMLNEREDYWQDYFHAKDFGYSIK